MTIFTVNTGKIEHKPQRVIMPGGDRLNNKHQFEADLVDIQNEFGGDIPDWLEYDKPVGEKKAETPSDEPQNEAPQEPSEAQNDDAPAEKSFAEKSADMIAKATGKGKGKGKAEPQAKLEQK